MRLAPFSPFPAGAVDLAIETICDPNRTLVYAGLLPHLLQQGNLLSNAAFLNRRSNAEEAWNLVAGHELDGLRPDFHARMMGGVKPLLEFAAKNCIAVFFTPTTGPW